MKPMPFILLIEDNEQDEILTIKALKKNNVLNEIAVARDGAEALDLLLNNESAVYQSDLPQLILLDLKLPKIDGLEVLRQIRSHHRTKIIPVVILTTSKEDSDLLSGYELGANSYVRKPVDFCEFADVVRSLGTYWLILNEKAPL
ncbi:MAG: response regulator [Bacteriovoracaceae bacterium]